MNLGERRSLRLATLAVLFFAQGVPWGFLAITVPTYLSARGLSDADLGALIAMSYWPYVFKFAIGPVIDAVTIRRFGRRRPWILGAQLMMAASLAGMLAIGDPLTGFDTLIWLVLAHTVFNAIQNVAVDALAIDLLAPEERGRASGFMYGAKYGGGAIGGAGMGAVVAWWGWNTAVVIQVVLLLAIAVVPALVREPAEPRLAEAHVVAGRPTRFWATLRGTLGPVLRLRSPVLAALLMLIASLAGGALSTIAPALFTQHLHWDPAEYSAITGGPGLACGLVGSIVAGFLADKLGHRRQVAIACAAMGAAWLVFAAGEPWWPVRGFVYVMVALEPFTQAVMIVSLWTLCMDCTIRRTAATQFAAYTSLTNLSTILGAKYLGPGLHGALDYRAIYFVAGAIQIAVIAILPLIDPGQVRRELTLPDRPSV